MIKRVLVAILAIIALIVGLEKLAVENDFCYLKTAIDSDISPTEWVIMIAQQRYKQFLGAVSIYSLANVNNKNAYDLLLEMALAKKNKIYLTTQNLIDRETTQFERNVFAKDYYPNSDYDYSQSYKKPDEIDAITTCEKYNYMETGSAPDPKVLRLFSLGNRTYLIKNDYSCKVKVGSGSDTILEYK